MPVHTNSIGSFDFIAMEGTVFLRQQELEIIKRPGVNGVGARRLGEQGKPFDIVTVNYEATLQAAANKLDDYIALKNASNLVALVYHDIPYGFFLLLEVKEAKPPYAIMSAIGGFTGGEQACHEVTWTFIG
jgi:hypothetical protein